MTPNQIEELAQRAGRAVRDSADVVTRERHDPARLRRRGRVRRIAVAAASGIVLVAAGLVIAQVRPSSTPTITGPSAVPSPTQQPISSGLEVLAVGRTPDRSVDGHIVTDQAGIDRLWARFDMEGTAPALPPATAAIVQPLAGNCESSTEVHAIESIRGDTPGSRFAAVWFDAAHCAEFLHDGTVERPPRTLFVIAVPPDLVRHHDGAVAVVGGVQDLDWNVVAVERTPDSFYRGVGVDSQAGVADVWRMFDMQGDPPELPAGHGALVVAVPGTCEDPRHVLAVEAFVDTEQPAHLRVVPHVFFEPDCGEPLPTDPSRWSGRTLFVISLPVDSATSLDGPREFIGCDVSLLPPGERCEDPADGAVPVHDLDPGAP